MSTNNDEGVLRVSCRYAAAPTLGPDSMRHPLLKSLVCWLCVLAFGLDMAGHALGPLVHGAHIAGCLRGVLEVGMHHHHDASSAAPFAFAPCGHGDDVGSLPHDPDPSHPATGHDDGHHLMGKSPDRPAVHAPVAVAVLVPMEWSPRLAVTRPARVVENRVRPPDQLGRLRAVVMLV